MEKLLNVEEVSKVLGLSEATVYGWASNRRIPCVKLSAKALRFRERDINDLIEGKLVCTKVQTFPRTNSVPKRKKLATANSTVNNNQVDRYMEYAKREVLRHAC